MSNTLLLSSSDDKKDVSLSPSGRQIDIGLGFAKTFNENSKVITKFTLQDEYNHNKNNDTEYGLAGYVQSGDEDHAKQVARRIRAGQISINGGTRGPAAPFGGFKTSGNGREHGMSGLNECLETKAIIGS